MIQSVLMLWITGLKYMMMLFKILQVKEIDLQQLLVMSEITLLTILSDRGSVEWQNNYA